MCTSLRAIISLFKSLSASLTSVRTPSCCNKTPKEQGVPLWPARSVLYFLLSQQQQKQIRHIMFSFHKYTLSSEDFWDAETYRMHLVYKGNLETCSSGVGLFFPLVVNRVNHTLQQITGMKMHHHVLLMADLKINEITTVGVWIALIYFCI